MWRGFGADSEILSGALLTKNEQGSVESRDHVQIVNLTGLVISSLASSGFVNGVCTRAAN